uniref:DNA-directed DNA polymerase n=1 Tax=Steinernema glaseri TaxID=37863 RepID=A0A1I7YF67_9BILA
MDSVPWLFVKRCASAWIVRASEKVKIHTLRVFVNEQAGKLYAAAATTQGDLVPLDSVNLKFITNFTISSYHLDNNWKEVTLNQLQRLVQYIKPTTEGRPPVRFDCESGNHLGIFCTSTDIYRKLLSMRLPVDSVLLRFNKQELQAAVEEFLESAGPLYYVSCDFIRLKQSTVDTLIDKFVPLDEGCFYMGGPTRLTKAQLERLVLKCEMSNKKIKIEVWPEGARGRFKVTDFFDFEKRYTKKKIEDRNHFRLKSRIFSFQADCGITGTGSKDSRVHNGVLQYYHRDGHFVDYDAPGYYDVVNPVVHNHSVHFREKLPENFGTEAQFDAVVPGYHGIKNLTPVTEFPDLEKLKMIPETEKESAAVDYYLGLGLGNVDQFRPVLSYTQMLQASFCARVFKVPQAKFYLGLIERNRRTFRKYLNPEEKEERISRQEHRFFFRLFAFVEFGVNIGTDVVSLGGSSAATEGRQTPPSVMRESFKAITEEYLALIIGYTGPSGLL